MKKFRIFLSSVQSEFATERHLLAEYIRTDALLGRFFDHEVGEPLRGGVAPGHDELPELAVREAIVNAVCHRDYVDNGSVQIMLFSDRLEILNPGTLPKGWTAEWLLRTHDSKARNLTIAQALNWAGYVEKSGNGTESIVRRCMDAGLPKPEYHPDNVDFKVIIWRNPARLGPVGAQLGSSQGAVGAQLGRSQGAVRTQSPREKCLILLAGSELKRKEIAVGVRMLNSCGLPVCGSGFGPGWRGQWRRSG